LDFLLTYKFSQDHLELFFSSVRRKGGLNDNPTPAQFVGIYKRLLLHGELTTSKTGNNCDPQDSTHVLNQISYNDHNTIPSISNQEESLCDQYDICIGDELDEYMKDVSCYIAGYVERKIKRKTKCLFCLSTLENDLKMGDVSLINAKLYGNLTYPSKDTQEICQLAENVFQRFDQTKSMNVKNIRTILINTTKNLFVRSYYDVEHLGEEEEEADLHKTLLVENVLTQYFNIRLFHYGKKITESYRKRSKRNVFRNLTQFNGN
jgi:hypothetical protein